MKLESSEILCVSVHITFISMINKFSNIKMCLYYLQISWSAMISRPKWCGIFTPPVVGSDFHAPFNGYLFARFFASNGFATCLLRTCQGGWMDWNTKEIRVCDLGFIERKQGFGVIYKGWDYEGKGKHRNCENI